MNILREISMSPELVPLIQQGAKVVTRRPFDEINNSNANWFSGNPNEMSEDELSPVTFFYDHYTNAGVQQPKAWLVVIDEYPEEGVIPLGQCPYGMPGDYLRIKGTELVIEVTAVCVERLQEITEDGAIKEGMGSRFLRDCKVPKFATLWDTFYTGFQSWQANPWVWVISFKLVDGAA